MKKNQKDREKVGRRLKQIRKRRGLTQAKFAKLIECSVRAYGNYERGERNLPRSIQNNIVQLTGEDPFDMSSFIRKRINVPFQPTPHRAVGVRHYLESVLQWRRKAILDWQRFEQQIYSAFGRWRSAVRVNTLFGATFAYWLLMFAIWYDLPWGEPIGNFEWALILPFFLMLITIPFQAIEFVRFFRWKKC